MMLTPTAEYVFLEQSSTVTSIEFSNCHSADRMLIQGQRKDSRSYGNAQAKSKRIEIISAMLTKFQQISMVIVDEIGNSSLGTPLLIRETRSCLSQPNLWTFHSLRPLRGTLPKSAWRER